MQYLLDTCVYLWAITNNRDKLSKKVLEVLLNSDNEIFVSIISQFETTIKHSKHQIENLSRPVIEYYKQQRIISGIELLNLKQEDIEVVSKLPPIHNDPFDRLLIAQAINNGMTIISPDSQFSKYPVRLIN
ncbi:MAG: type II toxin-antitoxin system VapC family toxin [Pseudomonadota bacterium]